MARGLILAAAIVLCASANGRAANKDGYYTIQGVGIESCEVWLAERQAAGPTAWYHQQWVLGYLTAFNRWVHNQSDVAEGLTNDQIFKWMDEYCHRNPRQSLSLATEAVVWALKDRQ